MFLETYAFEPPNKHFFFIVEKSSMFNDRNFAIKQKNNQALEFVVKNDF